MPVEIWTYQGFPPPDELVIGALDWRPQDTYLVATTGQQKARRQADLVAPARQVQKLRDGGQDVHLVFHQALRHRMGRELLTRSEERLLVLRAAEILWHDDLARLDQVRHDARPIAEVLADLAARGEDLSDPVTADRLGTAWSTPTIGEILGPLQRQVGELAREEGGLVGFEAAARAWIESAPEFGDIVVLEGFTRLTPLQQLLITRMSPSVRVAAIVPFNLSQSAAFEQVQKTWEPWWKDVRPLAETESVDDNALRRGQRILFTGAVLDGLDPSLQIEAHVHRHQEVRVAAESLKKFMDAGLDPEDIAVVTPRRRQLDVLLLEEASRLGLRDRVGIPPRLLLLTPLGRFVLTLYQTWRDGGVDLVPDQFETILSSGWLGAQAQMSAKLFRAVKDQQFRDLRQIPHWRSRLDDVLRTPPTSDVDRLPTAGLAPAAVRLWRDAVDRIEGLVSRLFADERTSIGGHVRRLLQELDLLPEVEIFQAEREVLEALRTALQRVAEGGALDISSEEFGDVLVSLARDYEEAAAEEDDGDSPPPHRVWVTTPEGIDGVSRRAVLFLGCDDNGVPRAFTPAWPRPESDLDRHLDGERYRFASVIRAAEEELTITYSRRGEAKTYGPSPYLRQFTRPDVPDIVIPAAAEYNQVPPTNPYPLRRNRYGLSELAQFGLCPFRYWLERLDPASRRFTASFHLRLLAQSDWINRALGSLHGRGGLRGDAVDHALRSATTAVEGETRALFPGLRPLDWQEVTVRVRDSLAWLAGYARYLEDPRHADRYDISFMAGQVVEFGTVVDDHHVVVEASIRHAFRRGQYPWPIDSDLLLAEWTFPASPEPGSVLVDVDGAQLFSSRSAAMSWWKDGLKLMYQLANGDDRPETRTRAEQFRTDLTQLIRQLQAGPFPKRPGEPCRYCAVRVACLGLEP